MRNIDSLEIPMAVSRLFQDANFCLPDDVLASLKKAREVEESPAGQEALVKIWALGVKAVVLH